MFKTKSGEIIPLTGLRGIAALMVVGHHAESAMLADRTHVVLRGQTWVDLFFILSGFVMGLVYLRTDRVDFRSFYIARLSRIYPLHIITAFAMAALLVAQAVVLNAPISERLSWGQAVREVTLTMALPIVGTPHIWNDPAWSISVEWWVYFSMFPLLAIIGGRLPTRLIVIIAGILLLAATAVLTALPPDFRFTRGWVAIARGEVGFFVGYALYRLAAVERRSLVPTPRLVDAAVLASLVAIYLVPQVAGYRDAWPVLLIFPIIILGCLGEGSITSRFLSMRPIHWCGKISYSIYLVHPFIIVIWTDIARRMQLDSVIMAILVSYTLTIPLAWISYCFIEAPARSIIRRILGPEPNLPLENARVG
jgi:peptidoglycan/LPS O-acetylase OafA/YrhL